VPRRCADTTEDNVENVKVGQVIEDRKGLRFTVAAVGKHVRLLTPGGLVLLVQAAHFAWWMASRTAKVVA